MFDTLIAVWLVACVVAVLVGIAIWFQFLAARGQKVKRMHIAFVMAFLMASFVGIGWFAFGKHLVERERFYRFDSIVWSNASGTQRYFMAKFLVDRDMLAGKTRDEVIELLGPPDSGGSGLIQYDLGWPRTSLFPIDKYSLELRFDGQTNRLTARSCEIRSN